MGQRLDLQTLLEELLGTDNVYFQPPDNVTMVYPCIVYSRDRSQTRFADNAPYSTTKKYQITYIDRDPDSDIPDKLILLEKCLHLRFFVMNNLNHDVFSLFF